jgi:hypothetical protein
MGLIPIILLILLLCGGIPTGGYGYGYRSHGLFVILIVIVLVLLLTHHI